MSSNAGDRNGMEGRPATAARLAAVLEAYGASQGRWPAPERAALAKLADNSGAENLADAAALDRIMDRLPSISVSHALEARILRTFDAFAARYRGGLVALVTRAVDNVWPGAPLWQPASALVLSLIIGLAAGVLAPSEVFAHDNGEQAAGALFDSSSSFDLGQGS